MEEPNITIHEITPVFIEQLLVGMQRDISTGKIEPVDLKIDVEEEMGKYTYEDLGLRKLIFTYRRKI